MTLPLNFVIQAPVDLERGLSAYMRTLNRSAGKLRCCWLHTRVIGDCLKRSCAAMRKQLQCLERPK